MLLGGLWHGAAWTFVVWGALHGFYLIVNHAFRAICQRYNLSAGRYQKTAKFASGLLTFFVVVIAWVLFRAETFQSASIMLSGMFGGAGLSQHKMFAESGLADSDIIPVALALLVALLLPNTQEYMRDFDPAYETIAAPEGRTKSLRWSPGAYWTWMPVAGLCGLAIMGMSPHRVSEFLYFQF